MAATTPKILCLTDCNPAGPDNGGIIRVRNLFRLLSRHGRVRVVLAGDYQDEALAPGADLGGFGLVGAVRFQPTGRWSLVERLRNEFDPHFLNTNHSAARPADRERLQQWIAEHDLVWVHNIQLANRFGLWRWPHSVLDIDDIPSTQYETELARANGLLARVRFRRQVVLWRRREKRLLERFDVVSVCSEPDRRLLGGSARIFRLPNSFQPPESPVTPQPVTPPRLGFIGDFRHAPNQQGCRWFVEQVWPLILARQPAARLRIVGHAGERQNFPADRNIDVLGWLADVHGEMATWSLTAVPIFTGGGTRVKIAEAFGRRCPVVATPVGAHGYEVVSGQDLLIADTPDQFAAHCLQILDQPALGLALAESAWRKFNEKWTWEAQAGTVARMVEQVLSGAAAHGQPG
jgi:glycosyltransferase involved in cell wall biosynthesis